MHVTFGKWLSLAIAIGYVIVAAVTAETTDGSSTGQVSEGGQLALGLFMLGIQLLFPLALIWFPDAIGGMTGYFMGGRYIDRESPGVFVSFFGWLILVGVPVIGWLMAL